MKNSQAIVVKGRFTNINLAGHGKTLNKYINDYSARPDATQSIPGVGMAQEWIDQIDDIYLENQFHSQRSFKDMAYDYLASEGVGFDQNHVSLSGDELKEESNQVQDALLAGHTGQRILVILDTDYLINQNTVSSRLKHKRNPRTGKKIQQSFPGGSFDLVDDAKLRFAIQNGMNQYIKNNGMQDPKWVGALQFNREHVHAHITCIDQAPLAESGRLMKYSGFWQDRGEILDSGKDVIRNGIDSMLTLTKGLHVSVQGNQAAREYVSQKAQTFDLQRQYQQQLASQLLRLIRLNDSRLNQDENAEEMYHEKLADYRDSLVMQEAREFNLPKSMTEPLNQQLDQVLDQQIQALSKQGVPDRQFLQSPPGIINTKLGREMQKRVRLQKSSLEQTNRQVTSFQFLMHDYNQKFYQGKTGNGSLAVYSLYGYELNKNLRKMIVEQADNPLNLVENYQRRGDLVSQRHDLLNQRERLLEEGYQSGWLMNPSQQEIKSLLSNPGFQRQLLLESNRQKYLGKDWISRRDDVYQHVEDTPTYRDLWLKSQSTDNNFGVEPQTVDMLRRLPVKRMLVSGLAGENLHPRLRQALLPEGNQIKLLDSDPSLKRFATHLREYQDKVIDYTVNGVQRGLIRADLHNFDSRMLLVPPEIGRPFDQRNDLDLRRDGFLRQNQSWKGVDGNLALRELNQEQSYLSGAQRYYAFAGQNSLVVDNLKWQQADDLKKLNDVQPVLANQLGQRISSDDQDISFLQHRSHHAPRSSRIASEAVNVPVTRRENFTQRLQEQQRLQQNIRQQEMNEQEAEGVVNDSRKLVHRVLTQELAV